MLLGFFAEHFGEQADSEPASLLNPLLRHASLFDRVAEARHERVLLEVRRLPCRGLEHPIILTEVSHVHNPNKSVSDA